MHTLIDPMRRERMRSYTAKPVASRKWTADERTWLIRAYMEKRPMVCPVCDAQVRTDQSGSGLQCPGCGNCSRD